MRLPGRLKRLLVETMRAANRLLAQLGWELTPRLPGSQAAGAREAVNDPGVMLIVGMSAVRPVTLVCVGAGYVGETGDSDPALEFLRQMRNRVHRAVLIEPVERRLSATRALLGNDPRYSYVACAVSSVAGTAVLWQIDDEADAMLRNRGLRIDSTGASAGHGWTSADRSHVIGLLAQALHLAPQQVAPHVRSIAVTSRTLTDITTSEGLDSIEYLQVDTEGFDDDVIMSLDLAAFAPAVIRCEFIHLPTQRRERLVRHLVDNGYSAPVRAGDLDAMFLRR
jgi:FkbM family methyltransferase